MINFMIKIAVCDDDRIDGEIIGRLLDQYALDHNQEILLRIFESGEKFLASKYIPDILLLDIFMYEKDGIQIGTEVREKYPDMIVIYTTNLKEKIMVAFNQLHVYGYLVKPINQEELYPILDDAIKKIRSEQKTEGDIVTFLSENNTVIKLSSSDIYYFEYYDRKVKIVTKDNIYVCKEKIGSIAERMTKYGFAMSHQSFVVNLYCVHEIKKQALVMKNGEEVFLAQKRASIIRKKLMQIARESG